MDALFYPASQAIVPLLVDEDHLAPSNALLQGSEEAASFVGPAVAGVLIAVAGASTGIGTAFAVDAGTFVFAALTLRAMARGGETKAQLAVREGSRAPGVRELVRDILEGIRYVSHDPALRAVLLLATVINFAFVGPMEVGLATLARTRFLGDAAAYGMMFVGWGAGALLGSLLGGVLGRLRRRGMVMLGMAAVQGAGLMLLGVLPGLAAIITIIGAMGLCVGFFNVLIFSWFQIRTDDAMLGRVMSLSMFAAFGMGPVSYAAAGVLAALGAPVLFWSAGGLLLAATALASTSSTVRAIE
jgi:hypothetical protein